jgi:hypothetical protein
VRAHARIGRETGGVDPTSKLEAPPTRREALQTMSVLEPVAKDGGSQLYVAARGDVHIHQHIHHYYNSQQANAAQNSARRFWGPQLPARQIYEDQLLTLFQVRGDAARPSYTAGPVSRPSPSEATLRASLVVHDHRR